MKVADPTDMELNERGVLRLLLLNILLADPLPLPLREGGGVLPFLVGVLELPPNDRCFDFFFCP